MAGLFEAGRTVLGKRLVLVTAGCLLVAAGGAVVAVGAMKSNDQDSLADASKVLQAVSVKMAPNGDLTSIKGAVVGTTTKNTSFNHDTTYDPKSTASDLPVRVLTSYRTATKSGTDLSDLDGYTGKVDIQVTVQNLTAKARRLSYDVNGRQRTQSALVGVPLTMVASTSLGDTKPSAVQTSDDSDSAKSSATNGVLSQDAKGNTQVQWATILAPPQLGSSTTMRLAVDAKDFQVPDFDISVQPGLVTDPSVGALIDSAFNPSDSSQYRLQQRTVALVADVNAVLARAGQSMDTVRTTLSDSSKTLGTKTVSDLKESSTSTTESVKGLQGRVGSLGRDLDGSLTETKSTTLEELQQLVTSINSLLGDTSAGAPTPALDADGCSTVVPLPKNATSIYGQVLRVSSLLKGYSQATSLCKAQVQQKLIDSVGPADPTAKACSDGAVAASVTCTLAGASKNIHSQVDKIIAAQAATDKALSELGIDYLNTLINGKTYPADPNDPNGQPTFVEGLVQKVDHVKSAAGTFAQQVLVNGRLNVNTDDLQAAFKTANDSYQLAVQGVDAIHQQAYDNAQRERTLQQTNADLATKICGMGLPTAQSNTLLGYVTSTDCNHQPLDASLLPAAGPMDGQIQTQVAAWDSLAAATYRPTAPDGSLAASVNQLGTDLGQVQAQINKVGSNVATDYPELYKAYNDLTAAIEQTDAANTAVSDQSSTVINEFNTAQKNVDTTFGNAEKAVGSAADLSDQIKTVTDSAQSNSDELGAQFETSVDGLKAAGTKIQQDGKKVVQQQKGRFAEQQKGSSTKISSSITKGLKQVDSGVTSSTRDLTGAQKLLTADLLNVLEDLGVRKVKGSGLLGAMATSVATTRSASGQLGKATDTTSAYANVRQGDIAGILLQQAQADASRKLEAALPAFHLALPASAQHRTVYSFHLGG